MKVPLFPRTNVPSRGGRSTRRTMRGSTRYSISSYISDKQCICDGPNLSLHRVSDISMAGSHATASENSGSLVSPIQREESFESTVKQ